MSTEVIKRATAILGKGAKTDLEATALLLVAATLVGCMKSEEPIKDFNLRARRACLDAARMLAPSGKSLIPDASAGQS